MIFIDGRCSQTSTTNDPEHRPSCCLAVGRVSQEQKNDKLRPTTRTQNDIHFPSKKFPARPVKMSLHLYELKVSRTIAAESEASNRLWSHPLQSKGFGWRLLQTTPPFPILMICSPCTTLLLPPRTRPTSTPALSKQGDTFPQ